MFCDAASFIEPTNNNNDEKEYVFRDVLGSKFEGYNSYKTKKFSDGTCRKRVFKCDLGRRYVEKHSRPILGKEKSKESKNSIDSIINKYLTQPIYDAYYKQMYQFVCYRAYQIQFSKIPVSDNGSFESFFDKVEDSAEFLIEADEDQSLT
ncbi:16342_t:CDS:2 [Funneliformis mosseae]|uniref:16342_t:CDS:1 n=1 Tax=Funneliformis mosseae TaxID=27381 RepID=A0A9N9I5Y2_FUNMO|nr:16342_t:CDS:2 [Funneliformis mosseae]